MATPIEPQVEDVNNEPQVEPNSEWNEVLQVIPEQFHGMVTPHFESWSNNNRAKIEEINSQYEPYKNFVEHGIEASELENGLRLMYEIDNNPQSVWNALGKAYGLIDDNDEEDEDSEEDNSTEQFQDPRFSDLQQGIELVSQIVLNEQREKADKAADIELENELSSLKDKYGDYDERFVLDRMSNGASGEEAVQAFNEFKNNLLQGNPRPFAPQILSSSAGGSGIPSQVTDPTKLSGKDTRGLVAQMLAAQFGPNNNT